jgi:hypothetical protein
MYHAVSNPAFAWNIVAAVSKRGAYSAHAAQTTPVPVGSTTGFFVLVFIRCVITRGSESGCRAYLLLQLQ